MIEQHLSIAGYWSVIVYYSPNIKHYDYIFDVVKSIGCPKKQIDEIADVIVDKLNTGATCSNISKQISIIIINKADSVEEFLNTIIHEAKHLQSHICEYYNVPENSEDAAYLIGYSVMKMYRSFARFL